MKIFKSINNNIVSAMDENDREVVVIGKGIGYKAVRGSIIPPEKIDKIFVMSNQNNMERLKDLFASIPTVCIEITDEILIFAKKHLHKRLNETAYFTLADHISFAVTRRRQGMEFQNILLAEVRRFYPKEFEIGLYALQLLRERLNEDMPEDEAASIALHILNAEYDISISDAYQATQLMERIIDTIKGKGYILSTDNYHYERFLTHLRYLSQRIIRQEQLPHSSCNALFGMVELQYPAEIACAKKVREMINNTKTFHLPDEELACLALHIRRIAVKEI
ncbi:MAG: PRD domain-containing protein [Lachnospiraceae bacterium]|nr:PRD domain-containing protein [Lachnospiraceae bacterium]